MAVDVGSIVRGVEGGDRRAVARAITLVESSRDGDRAIAEELLAALGPRAGGAIRVGMTGPPGAGKSTLIEALGLHVVDAGRTSIAVLAVDPSSTRTGGSILGDKTRMAELSRHPDVFIRPSPSRGDLGGLGPRTADVVAVCEAAGFGAVIVETVGVGQSEIDVADVVDTFVLLVSAGAGDELQGVKRGVMELADVVAVTKADGDMAGPARQAVSDYRHALHLLRPRYAGWTVPVLETSSVTGTGIVELWDAVLRHRDHLAETGALEQLRRHQRLSRFRDELSERSLEAARRTLGPRLRELEELVAAGVRSPTAAATEALGELFSSAPPKG